MKKTSHYSLILCLLAFFPAMSVRGQNMISQYEYWFNQDYGAKVVQSISPAPLFHLNTLIPTSGLTKGLNTLHIRFRDDSLHYSPTLSHFFFKLHAGAPSPQSLVSEYEYWFDDQYASRVVVPLTAASGFYLNALIPASGLAAGFHSLHLRFRDDSLQYSPVISGFFFQVRADTVTAVLPDRTLSGCEYWFDDNVANKVQLSFPGSAAEEHLVTAINTAAIPFGLHRFNIRFLDNAGLWSIVDCRFFYKMNADTTSYPSNLITAYRYWFDGNDSGMVTHILTSPVQQLILLDSLDMTMIWKGQHTVHFQFMDLSGLWSAVNTDTITKNPMPIASFTWAASPVCDSTVVTFQNQSIDGDLHNWDFGDGQFSNNPAPVHTYFNPGTYLVVLTATDTSLNTSSTLQLPITVDAYARKTITVSACGSFISPGGTQVWTSSGVYQDTLPNPPFCDSIYTVNLTINQVYHLTEYDTICAGDSYIFPDGYTQAAIISSTQHVSNLTTVLNCDSIITTHLQVLDTAWVMIYITACDSFLLNGQTYTQSGQYTQVLSGMTGCDSTLSLDLIIKEYPVTNLGHDTVLFVNYGQVSILLDAGLAESYLWSDGSKNQTLLVDTFVFSLYTDHLVSVTASNALCSSHDTIMIRFDDCSGTIEPGYLRKLRIYPNPTRDFLQISGPALGSVLELYDSKGQKLQFATQNQATESMDLSTLAVGIYWLRIVGEQEMAVIKIIRY